jgi:capsid protein
MIALEARHSCPTFLNAARNVTGWASSKAPRSKFIRKLHHACKNWYEAGWPIWGGQGQSYLPSLVQDARYDQNYVTRREMLRKMRYWSQNSALLESILSVGERYTVGASGLHVAVYPNTDEISTDADDWYTRAEQVIHEWFQDCGWNGETMELLLKIGYRCQKVDGEIFYLKTRKQSSVEIFGKRSPIARPCLQLVEAHRCETPWNKFDSDNLIDGVQFEKVSVGTGAQKRNLLLKQGYWFRDTIAFDQNEDSWNVIPESGLFHVFNSHRANQYRGLSDFYSCESDLHKLEDVIEIELKAQASQSVRAVGIESNSGAAATPLDPKIEAIQRATGRLGPQVDASKEFLTRIENYRKETGAYIYGLKTNEKIHFDAPNRPSEATLNLLEFLTNNVMAGGHSPRCLVFQKISGASARAQGTEVRAELDSADLYYRSDFHKWKNFVRDATIFFMEWAVKNDLRVADAPSNWRECLHIQQPEACNVDVGYTTQAQLMMLAAGASDYEMILGPQGTSFMTVAKRLLRQQKWMERNGLKVTLPALLPGQIPLEAPAEKETADA